MRKLLIILLLGTLCLAVLPAQASGPTPSPFGSIVTAKMPGTPWMPGDFVGKAGATPSSASAGTPSSCSSAGDDDRCEQWATTVARDIAGVELGGNGAWDSALSPDGTVGYVTGKAAQTVGDMFTAAIDVATGITLWKAAFDASPLGDFGSNIAVSPDGRTIAVVGTSIRSGPQVLGSIYTVAYEAATGQLLWSAPYINSTAGVPSGAPTLPSPAGCCWFTADGGVTFAADGTAIVVTGNITSPNWDNDGLVVVYEVANGALRWSKVAGGPGYQFTMGAVAAGDDVYTTGMSPGSPGPFPGTFNWDATATRFDGRTGDVVWTKSANLGRSAFPKGLAIDPSGTRLFATLAAPPKLGWGEDSYGVVFGTVAYDTSDGRSLWVSRYGGEFGMGIPSAIAAGPEVILENGARQSRVYVTGMVSGEQGQAQWDFGTVAYDAETGQQLFDAHYGTGRDERPWAIALSADGSRLFTTGRNGPPYGGSPSGGENPVQPMTIGYDGATGAQLWAARYLTEAGEGGDPIGVHWSALGRVITAGTVVYAEGETPNTHTGDFLVLGYLE